MIFADVEMPGHRDHPRVPAFCYRLLPIVKAYALDKNRAAKYNSSGRDKRGEKL